MREIRFRAWVKEVFENGEFAYGGYMIESHEIKSLYLQNMTFFMDGPRGTGIEYFVQGSFLPGHGHLEKMKFEDIELMQYTGLKDRNGKEIYEGDIVKGQRVRRGDIRRHIGKVEYRGAHFIVDGVKQYEHITDDLDSGYEVIGNIYEHPHLLKEGAANA